MLQRGFVPIIILIGILVIIAVAGGAYYVGTLKNSRPQTQNQIVVSPVPQSISSTPIASPDETAKWKTYTHKYFTFKYPGDWTVVDYLDYPGRSQDSKDNEINIAVLAIRNKIATNSIYFSGSELGLNDELAFLHKGMENSTDQFKDVSIKNVIFAGYSAIDYINADTFQNNARTRYLIIDKTLGSKYKTLLIRLPENDSLIDQILSTFKFIDQNANSEMMMITGKIVDFNSQVFINPDVTINSVDSIDKCTSDSEGNFTCNAKLVKGKTYGIYFNNPQNNSSFAFQYFTGDPGKTLDLGTRKSPR